MDASRDETRSLLGPTLIGTGLQLVMVLAGHYSPGVAQFFAPGGRGDTRGGSSGSCGISDSRTKARLMREP